MSDGHRMGRAVRWLVVLLLLAGVIAAWPTYIRYFAVQPVAMLAGLAIAFVMFLPSLWTIRHLDRREPEPPIFFWGSIAFVVLFAPIASRLLHGLIDAGATPWVIVGPVEEMTKLLPLLLITLLWRPVVSSMRDGLVYGALGGFGFAIVEFAANFATDGYPNAGWADLAISVPARLALGFDSHIIWGAITGAAVGYALARRGRIGSVLLALAIIALVMATHGLNDLFGKFVGPLAMEALIEPLQAVGIDLMKPHDDLTPLLLIYGAVVNLLLVNLAVWPVLWWAIRRSRTMEQQDLAAKATTAVV